MRRLPAIGFAGLLIAGGCASADDLESASPSPRAPSEAPSTAASAEPSPVPPPDHVIGVRDGANGAELFDRRTGEPFIVRGVNYTIRVSSPVGLENRVFAVDVWDADRFGRDLESLAERGYNTVRLWIDSCSVGPECLAPVGSIGLNPDYLDNLAEGISIAKERGMLLLLTSNDIPDGGGYGDEANSRPDSEFAGIATRIS